VALTKSRIPRHRARRMLAGRPGRHVSPPARLLARRREPLGCADPSWERACVRSWDSRSAF